jgi:glucose-6-phosphate-specific signal transduction histidine kinase
MPDDPTPDESGLKKLMDQVAGAKGDASSWPVTIFLLSIFVIILSILGIKLALTKRRAAELARKLREQEEAAKQAKENEAMAGNEEARKDAQEVIKDVEARVAAIQSDMDARRVAHEEYVKELKSISDWDQIVVVDARKPS